MGAPAEAIEHEIAGHELPRPKTSSFATVKARAAEPKLRRPCHHFTGIGFTRLGSSQSAGGLQCSQLIPGKLSA